MSKETHGEWEPVPERLVTAPANELFHDAAAVAKLWPEALARYPSFLERIEQHARRAKIVNEVFAALPAPTIDIKTAVEHGMIDTQLVAGFYQEMGDMLVDEDYERLALYLPFEIIPPSSWKPEDNALSLAAENFRTSYMTAWYWLLSIQDVRANFTDGDVLEENLRQGDLERVVKATHLIPELINKGMIDIDTARQLLEYIPDPLAKNGITEALASMKLAPVPPRHETTIDPDVVTPRRSEWLARKALSQQIDGLAEQFSETGLPSDILTDLSISSEDSTTIVAYVEGIRQALEKSHIEESGPRALYNSVEDRLIDLYLTSTDEAVREQLAKTFRQAYHLGMASKALLDNIDIATPQLSGSLKKNLELMPETIKSLEQLITSIEQDSELKNLIYPVLSIGGSRLKGYGTEKSDLDLGVFIRPSTLDTERRRLRTLIEKHFAAIGLTDEPLEIWLEEQGDNLTVKPVQDDEAVVADKYWTHILFGAAYLGNPTEISRLQSKLLPSYFHSSTDVTYGRHDRALYLERMEQDLLQYRLMHDGYQRHYPRVTAQHDDKQAVDGDSMFWDAGYRRLATQLFVEKVFIPKLV